MNSLLEQLKDKKPTKLGFSVVYDELKLNAWVKSENLSLPLDSARVIIELSDGITSSLVGKASSSPISTEVSIPGLYGLSVNSSDITLVDNENFEPEQALLVEMSDTVNSIDVKNRVSAWILPIYNPNARVDDKETVWSWSGSDVDETVLQHATPLKLDVIPTELDYQKLHSFQMNAESGRYVYLKVKKGISSFGGYQLGQDYSKVLTVPEYPKLMRIMAEGSLLSMKGDKRLSVITRNVPGMWVNIGRVKPEQLQHLVTMNDGSFSQPSLGNFGQDRITEHFVHKRLFTNKDPKKALYEQIDLGDYLLPEGQPRRGVFLVNIHPFDPDLETPDTRTRQEKEDARNVAESYSNFQRADYYENGNSHERSSEYREQYSDSLGDQRLVVVTDLGILAKKSIKGGRDVYIQSIELGTPVSMAKVDVIAKNGDVLLSGMTDDNGHVYFESLVGFVNERFPAMYVVQKEGDLSFLPIIDTERRLDYSRFDIDGISNARDEGELTAFLFSDRGLYRPGETFNIGVIVRAEDWQKRLMGIPVQAEIVDPRGMRVSRQNLILGEKGFEEIQWTTSESAPTGMWQVNLYLSKDDDNRILLGNTSVQIKDFQPDRMKVKAEFSEKLNKGWIKPSELVVKVDVQNLFGTPAQDRVVTGDLNLLPYWPSFTEYKDYSFYDPNRGKKAYEEQLVDQKTNEDGIAAFKIDLNAYDAASFQLSFLAKAYEQDSGRHVATTVSTLVSSRDYLIGQKVNGNLNYVQRDAKQPVEFIAINAALEKTSVSGLTLTLIEKKYISVLTKQSSGVYKYQSRLRETELSSSSLSIPAKGLDYLLDTQKPGHFKLIITDDKGVELNKVEYVVVGTANLSRSLERNAELQLSLGKAEYEPNEDIQISIQAPYTGSGLITIERDKVYTQTWFKADTTSSVQKIRVPADFEGQGYINVQFIRDPSSDEIYMSPLSYGVIPFKVSLAARTAKVALNVPELIKPDSLLKMQVTTQKPERMVVFAIDEGILQVARYKLRNPLEHFFRKRALEVQTSQILDLILPSFSNLIKASAPGGDGSDELMGNYLNPFARKREKPVVYWSGLVDVYGEHTFEYPVPEYFNGTLRVMAVTVTDNQIGTYENKTVVRGDFVLTPNVPLMVTPNDIFEVSSGLANNLTGLMDKEIPIKVTLTSSDGLEIVGNADQILTLGEKREGYTTFKVKARDVLGNATLYFTAEYEDKKVSREVNLSIRPATPFRSQITMGSTKLRQTTFSPLRSMHDEFAKRDIKASFSPLVVIDGLSRYLIDFEHSCTEQIVSQAIPNLVINQNPELLSGSTNHQRDATMTALIRNLQTRQNSEGGFGVWRATPKAEGFVSAYTVLFLLEAKERNLVVPEEMLNKANAYLSVLAADESLASLEDLRTRAFATYLLTRQGIITTNYLASIHSRLQNKFDGVWQKDLANAWLASSYKLLKQDKIASQLMDHSIKVLNRTAANNERYTYYYDSLIRDTSILWLVQMHYPEKTASISQTAINNILEPLLEGRFNTLSSAMSLLAFDRYGNEKTILPLAESLDITAKESSFGQRETVISEPKGLVTKGEFTKDALSLAINNPLQNPVWYSLIQAGFDQKVPDEALKEGLEVIRDYRNQKGDVVSTAEIGEELNVHIRIRATTENALKDIAIVDLLPGGFEPVQNPPQVSDDDDSDTPQTWVSPIGVRNGSSWQPDYADIREDRVVIYGTASPNVQEFIYRIRAISPGEFVIPPAYGEALYDQKIQARSPSSGTMTIVRKKPSNQDDKKGK